MHIDLRLSNSGLKVVLSSLTLAPKVLCCVVVLYFDLYCQTIFGMGVLPDFLITPTLCNFFSLNIISKESVCLRRDFKTKIVIRSTSFGMWHCCL